jgi:hypothetical protein
LEAWDLAQQADADAVHITPEGERSTGRPGETLIPDDPNERYTYALRIVAQRCIYGVDKNPLAVEMAKLSLWLLTLAKDKPFEFLDHSIRCGDSLVGIHSLDQLRHFSLKPDSKDPVLFKGPLDDVVDEAIALRLKLEDMSANTVEDVKRQEELLAEAKNKMAWLRCAADLLVAAEFWGETAKDKQERVRHALAVTEKHLAAGTLVEFERVAETERRGQLMFHWPLEFPEVIVKRGGFDGFVGNPPFMGGTVATASLTETYMRHVRSLCAEWHGKADIVAAFLRRADELTQSTSVMGIISTSALLRGETNDSGLRPLLTAQRRLIVFAIGPKPWPGSATVEVVGLALAARWSGPVRLNDTVVTAISNDLQPVESFADSAPEALESGFTAYLGAKISARNLTRRYDTLGQESVAVKGVLASVIGGEELYSLSSLDAAPLAIDPSAITKLPPTQAKQLLSDLGLDSTTSICHAAPASQMFVELGESELAFACGETSFHELFFRRIPTDKVIPKHKVFVFPKATWADFCVLQSALFATWAWRWGLRREFRLVFSSKRCAHTFPRPKAAAALLGECGRQLHDWREHIMQQTGHGLTSLFYRYCDPTDKGDEVTTWRDLQIRMDHMVLHAYDWSDVNLSHGFYASRLGFHFTISEAARREVLQRLLKLNHERYAEEVRQGLHDKKKSAKKGSRIPSKSTDTCVVRQPSLFDGEEDS